MTDNLRLKDIIKTVLVGDKDPSKKELALLMEAQAIQMDMLFYGAMKNSYQRTKEAMKEIAPDIYALFEERESDMLNVFFNAYGCGVQSYHLHQDRVRKVVEEHREKLKKKGELREKDEKENKPDKDN